MIEILKIIVLACNIPSGSINLELVENKTKTCRKELIQCFEKKKPNGGAYTTYLKECLMEQK